MLPVLVLLWGGCGDSPSEPDVREDEAILTDRDSYEMVRDTLVILGDSFPSLGVRIDYVFRNRTGSTVYIVRCGDPLVVVERQGADGTWSYFWSRGSEGCLEAPIVVEPGGRHEGSFDFSGAEHGVEGFSPVFPTDDLDGTYRMRLPDVIHLSDPADYPDGIPVEPELVRSNTFEISVAR